MNGPHRRQRYRDLCAGTVDGAPCKRGASVVCLRCAAPLCDRHVPPPDTRCEACEADFASSLPDRRAALRTEARVTSAVSVTGAVVVGALSGLGVAATVGFTALVVCGAHWFRMMAHLAAPDRAGLGSLLARHRRRRFLREQLAEQRQPRGLLGG